MITPCCFLQGGASYQFFQIPMNFLGGGTANYINTGSWSSKAIKEAKLFGDVNEASSSKDKNFSYIPKQHNLVEGAQYTHFTSNNTIFGTEFKTEPESDAPLICDTSSNMMSKPIDVSKYGMIYAGAQKNLGPSGVALVILNKELAESGPTDIPTIMQYRTMIKGGSMFNTPPTLGIFVMGLVFKWMKRQGGLAEIQKKNEAKAALLYDFLDGSDFWRTPVAKEYRSMMNVVFNLPTEELEKKLVDASEHAGFAYVKGHRSVGGLRASIYNAMPAEDIQSYVDFLKQFEQENG